MHDTFWKNATHSFLENAQAHGLMSDEDLANYVKQNSSWVVEKFIAALPPAPAEDKGEG